MSQAPFVIQPQLTAIAMAYQNERFIADEVFPRIPVASSSFKWTRFTLEDGFTIPNTRVGRRSKPNEIDWSGTEQTDSTQDYALDDAVPQSDIDNARAAQAVAGVQPVNPEMRSTELLSELVALDREQRAATLAFTLGNYPSSQRTTLSGSGQWSHVDSDPVAAILTAMDAMVVRPNIMTIGQSVWTQLRQHAKVTAALLPMGGNAATRGGVAARAALAELLELDEIIVGSSWYNSAKPGQTATLTRLWGKHAALHYRAPNMQSTDRVTFGFTGQWGGRIAGTVERDPNVGMRGGNRVRVGESVKELIASNDAGYFFQDAVA